MKRVGLLVFLCVFIKGLEAQGLSFGEGSQEETPVIEKKKKAGDQKKAFVLFSGRIVDAHSREPVVGAYISSRILKEGAISDHEGAFTVVTMRGDILNFSSIAYRDQRCEVIDTSSRQYKLITMDAEDHILNEVVVYGSNTINPAFYIGKKPDVPAMYREPWLEKEPGVLDFFGNPAGALYASLSRKVKDNRKSYAYIKNAQEMAAVYKIYTRDFVREIVLQDDEELERFMVYCNRHINLKASDREDVIRTKVLLLWGNYKRELQLKVLEKER